MPETTSEDQTELTAPKHINGLLVSYQDDGISSCVHSALRGKKRVHYKCMDVMSNFLALGTSVGAIYLFRLASLTHSQCRLVLVQPCDQGPIEVIRFVPSRQAATLLVAIGTARGSLVIFELNLTETQTVAAQEIYRAEKFTKSELIGIKFIEPDQDLLEPCQAFTKLYICDQKCRIFVLDSNSIYPAFTLLYNNRPTPVLDVLDSDIHQIFVHRSQLLLSTDERTQVFKEYSARPDPIGKTQRRRGFYGACFFNANYRPARLQQQAPSTRASQQTIYSSTASLADLENIIIFVARPKFSLWQVNYKREVLFTNKFEPAIKSMPSSRVVPLINEPARENAGDEVVASQDDDPEVISQSFAGAKEVQKSVRSDHFERLIPIYSSTLGNLLLSHTRHEIFIIDPTNARLVTWHASEKPIQQVSCSENEIFVLFESSKRNFQVERIVLLAPTQFVLELHRLNRQLSLMAFVELFSDQFRSLMALPLSGPNVITTEGGLLRNILWSTWREHESRNHTLPADGMVGVSLEMFRGLVVEIISESEQLRKSIENLTDSQLFFTASNDNIERLCAEPYASMVSLDISIANLHTNHVVHFSQEALNRQKSLAKLSRSVLSLSRLKRTTSARLSLLNLDEDDGNLNGSRHKNLESVGNQKSNNNLKYHFDAQFDDKKVFVEPLKTKSNNLKTRAVQLHSTTKSSNLLNRIEEVDLPKHDSNTKDQTDQADIDPLDSTRIQQRPSDGEETPQAGWKDDVVDRMKCPQCKWPKPRAHLKPMHHSQQIQFGWLQENLVPNFEENIEQIESRAFKHGLWHLVLRCLAFKNSLEEYIICCIMLDDVRLLNLERFVNIKCSEEEFINLVFKQLECKLDFLDAINDDKNPLDQVSDDRRPYDLTEACLKCKHIILETNTNGVLDIVHLDDEDEENNECSRLDIDDDGDDDISFNLINLVKKIMLRKSADTRRAVETLLRHPKLLDRSRIPASFYLQALSNQCSILRRTRLKV